ncbi:MAG: KR domain-containing protein, partial [Psychrosphaera sp.]|nr:KR domain-containing protein [Psychrosphaera sp.]
KVNGGIALDEATQDLPLDFFICFGALSGVHGAYTQIDYAMANAFLDSYMHYRESLVVKGDRSGKSCSIDWPYWQDGGMRINPEIEKVSGISPMPSDVGISAFYQSMQQVQTLVVYEQNPSQNTAPVKARFENREQLKAHLSDSLLNITASLLGVNKDDIDSNADLGDIGADSIVIVSFINQLNKRYQLDLSPTLLFKYPTLNSLLAHLLEEYSAALTGAQPVVEESPAQPTTLSATERVTERVTEERIAIIGISGEFPEAKNVDQFWQNLAQGKDCVTQRAWLNEESDIPPEVRWLGNIARNDNFDPLFYNIAPAESPRIHLQERLLMTHVYKCIEDAGYDPASLAGSNTGIFIGCQSNYHDGMVTSNAFAPNRMSYFLDLHGPSEGIDTTCSSSLVAIHKAIQSIQQGDCDQAIVGGVNIIDSPKASLALHEIGVLSPTGRCKTFSNDADGFVRGEGVGMIFIKKLSACKQDNDKMYATILGSALNHGGKSQGFTVPNSNAQSMLLKKAWQTAGIDPATISYIECHGTGTTLGDPVEVDALKDAFKGATAEPTQEHKKSQCALGSVKSNIGHLEIAAGIAGVIKVLLQFKHKTLVPSLHVNELNPYLALDNTPFTVQTEKQAWTCSGKRRAAVSSFGISGVNAHIVLEEIVEEIVEEADAHIHTETKAPTPSPAQKQDQWLILNNSWQAKELPCPVDWHNHIGSVLRDHNILIVSQTAAEQTPLLSLLNDAQRESISFNIESMLFDKLSSP